MMSEAIEENEFFGLMPDEFARYCKSYGKVNPKAIAYLRKKFDTEEVWRSLHLMNSVVNESASVAQAINQIYTAARDIVDKNSPRLDPYDLATEGKLGWHLYELREQLYDLETKLEAIRVWLAPLERLISVEEEMKTKNGMWVPDDEGKETPMSEHWSINF